ncbi:MAG TPA: PQQ-binding-like beta-propeller repeat protein [Myxococcales bacterium]|jgi:outer membrane protein assembly factor BamB|nr:PQQ-binding-like beta-propeller repeat protein [Myxococcales bacterium]
MGRGLSALVLCATACAGGPSRLTQEGDGGSGVVAVADAGSDGGAPDSGLDAGEPPDSGVDAGTDAGPLGGGDWRQYRYDARGCSENPGTFAASEVPNLVQLWKPAELGQYVYTQAVVGDGLVVYTTAFSGKVVAFDERDGAFRWKRDDLTSLISTSCGGSKQTGYWSAAAIEGNVVYLASPDGNAYALRATDGSTIWAARIADPSAAGHGEFVQSSPAVSTAFGRLYLGVASSAHCDEVAGRIVAVDLATGAVQSQPLVDPGQQGATIWSSIAVAEDEDRLYATTGNRIGPASAEPNAQAFLALDPHTLRVLDRWQNPTPLENSDFGSSPALVDAGGLKLVAATSKDGNLYVLRRNALSAGPLWTYPIATTDPTDPTVGGDPSAGFGSISTPAAAHGLLYAAGGRTPSGQLGQVVAFKPDTGGVVWQRDLPGYVLAPIAAAGEILAVEASAPDGSSSQLLILDAASGSILRSIPAPIATFAGPSIAHGAIFWTDAFGHAAAWGATVYRR